MPHHTFLLERATDLAALVAMDDLLGPEIFLPNTQRLVNLVFHGTFTLASMYS